MKFFNTTGPINPNKHYYVQNRYNWEQVELLIHQDKYFVLHAPRQTGKTTEVKNLVNHLNKAGTYTALYLNVEPAQAARSNVELGIITILKQFYFSASLLFGRKSKEVTIIEDELEKAHPDLTRLLQTLSLESDKPVVLFIDEIDSLIGDTLISVLRQLRAGYIDRPSNFPQAVCLIGVRDVRDYRIWSAETGGLVLGGSAFNIKAESIRLEDFTRKQVFDLYHQHTQETGQQFTDQAIDYAFHLTQGQPWLVNALAYQACFRKHTDRSVIITQAMIEDAKDELIRRRDTHLDVLVDRLSEPRVYTIIDSIISGFGGDKNIKTDDLQYVRDLGLVTLKGVDIANPIYKEIIPRELTYTKQEMLPEQTAWYTQADGQLDFKKLLKAFTQFYRENSEIWLERFDYKESGPHLILMAFLQRIVNGGGKIHREYALGRKRVDLHICWPYNGGKQSIVIELKVKRAGKTREEGLEQTAEYMDKNNATEGHLVIFDRKSNKPWDEKIFDREESFGGRVIHVWGM